MQTQLHFICLTGNFRKKVVRLNGVAKWVSAWKRLKATALNETTFEFMRWLQVRSPVCYRLSNVFTVSAIFPHVINLFISSPQDAVMAFSLEAFKRGLDKFLRITREYLFFSVSYFCIGIALNWVLHFLKSCGFVDSQVLNIKKWA